MPAIKPFIYYSVKLVEMMNEEQYIEQRVGKRNPFCVPEGFFDSFAEQMVQSLPERQPRSKSFWLRPSSYAIAASVCGLLIGAAVYLHQVDSSQQTHVQVVAVQDQGDSSFDEAADYVMLDNQDIYACLAGY